jgi:GT2 family glycosyltransferase
MDVSIIIVNYNTISLLVNAVDSIFEKTEGIEYEIIVVDNNSSDNSKNILAEKYGNKVIYLALSENVGFGRANNEAAKIAKGRNLFFLNPDTILLNNAVKILSDYLDDNQNSGVCGGNLYDKKGQPMHSFSRYLPSFLWELDTFTLNIFSRMIYGKSIEFNHTNQPINVGYITGADMMIRKEILEDVGFFDNDFFMYYEEAELTYRIKKSGYKVCSVPQAKIVHLEGKASPSSKTVRLKMTGRRIYYKKKYDSLSRIIINIIFSLSVFMHFSVAAVKGDRRICRYLQSCWLEYFIYSVFYEKQKNIVHK